MKRAAILQQLASNHYDLAIIGGGATGAGLALDASLRGLRVVLLEQADFMAGTSSKSTKLVHGGVRYLEQAVRQRDPGLYQLVRDALAERKRMLAMAPHLCRPIQLVTPVTGLFERLYYRLGLELYDRLAGSERLGHSQMMSAAAMRRQLPGLHPRLSHGVGYWDGQFDDARFGLAIMRTAAQHGAHCLNYVRVDRFILEQGQIQGLHCQDQLSQQDYPIRCRAVINATGPFTDHIRQLQDPACSPLLTLSRGSHLVSRRQLTDPNTGLLIPKTADGRVLFVLPWQGQYSLIGTTDDPAELSLDPAASQQDLNYLLDQVNPYLATPLSEADIGASFSGLRPLVSPSSSGLQGTSQISRDHYLHLDPSGLISLTGGKWTTWRKMAEDGIDLLLEKFPMPYQTTCQTAELRLLGAQQGVPNALSPQLPESVRQHLWQHYGDEAEQVLASGEARPLLKGQPYLACELVWQREQEFACQAHDHLHRRWRIGLLDTALAEQLQAKL